MSEKKIIKIEAKKSAPVSEKSNSFFDKAKNLIVESMKFYSNGEKRTDSVKLTPSEVKKLQQIKSGDVSALRQMLYPLCRAGKLNLTSDAQKLNLCSHSGSLPRRHCFNPVARAIGRNDLMKQYGANAAKSAEKSVTKKTVKKTEKKPFKKQTTKRK